MIDKHILKHEIGCNNKLRDVLNQEGKADECPRENIRQIERMKEKITQHIERGPIDTKTHTNPLAYLTRDQKRGNINPNYD